MNEANKFGKDTKTRYNLRNLDDAYAAIEKLERDRLTKLYRREFFEDKVDEMLSEAKKANKNVGYLLVDVDHFKRVNDTYDHDIGDQVLAYIAGTLAEKVRVQDSAPVVERRHNHDDGTNDLVGKLNEETVEMGRVGGEEFGIALYGVSEMDAYKVAERIRGAIESKPFTANDGTIIPLTISVGLTTTETSKTGVFDGPSKSRIDFEETAATRHDLYKSADKALKWAKLDGRNRTRIYSRSIASRRAGESVGSANTHELVAV